MQPTLQVVYCVPACASETPASGNGNLLGAHIRSQEANQEEAIKKIAKGSSKYFPVFIVDTGKK